MIYDSILFSCLQVDLERARTNFKLWYGGVPRLVVERPSYSSDELKDKRQALDAIAAASVVQVCKRVFLCTHPIFGEIILLSDPVCFRGGV